jgi:esterase/lipase superfamily enzyme
MATQWLITNRSVVGDKVVESANDYYPRPVFRLATVDPTKLYDPVDAKLKVTDALIQQAVKFVPDDFVDDYGDLDIDDLTGEKGTRRMFAEVYKSMHDTPADVRKGDTLFFIHGFNYDYASALHHFGKLHDVYVRPPESPIKQIVYFTWPSIGKISSYEQDQRIAPVCGGLLGRLFGKLIQFYAQSFARKSKRLTFCNRKIHIMAHSMGNQVLREFARGINDFVGFQRAVFGQVLLVHADIEWNALEPGQPLHAFEQYCDRMTVYNHKSDDALGVSEATKNAEKRLGKHGPRAKSLISERAVIVDVTTAGADAAPEADSFLKAAQHVMKRNGGTNAREVAFDHWGYVYRDHVIADIYRTLAGEHSHRPTRKHVEGPLFRLL